MKVKDEMKINYEKSYVAFLDVLGFKNLVFSENKEQLELYFTIVNKGINHLKMQKGKKEIGSIIISDAIILTIPQGNSNNEKISNLRNLCIAIGIIQNALAHNNIWLRGAISSGDTYFDSVKHQIVGPAYINAYLLEEKIAKTPRVILDNKIIKELNCTNSSQLIEAINNMDLITKENPLWKKSKVLFSWNDDNENDEHNYINKDVPLFIDYLLPFVIYGKNQAEDVVTNLEKSIYEKTDIYPKYKWVANYLISILYREDKYENLRERLKQL